MNRNYQHSYHLGSEILYLTLYCIQNFLSYDVIFAWPEGVFSELLAALQVNVPSKR